MITAQSIRFKSICMAAVVAFSSAGGEVVAQPTFGNPSPTAGSRTSEQANAAADVAAYRETQYANKGTKGPALVVIPGEIKSAHTTFAQSIKTNNIADFGELELSQANFVVLERKNFGHLFQEISLAYDQGDASAARRAMQAGGLKTAKWVVRFDVLKAEQIGENKEGFDGRTVSNIAGRFIGGMTGSAARTAGSSVKAKDATGVWLVGMRYKVLDVNTTEQVAQGYKELKMEVGATQTSILGVSQGAKGGVGLDTMVHRLVQTLVYEIDSKYK
jgi:hypothetical protein